MVITLFRFGYDFATFPLLVIIPAEFRDLIADSFELWLFSNFLAKDNNKDVCLFIGIVFITNVRFFRNFIV